MRARRAPSACWPPEVATPLALVLVELVQNAVEHGLGDRGGTGRGRGAPAGRRTGGGAVLVVAVADDGAGLPRASTAAAAASGLQIVRTLVEGELGGTLRLGAADPGTRVDLDLPLPAEVRSVSRSSSRSRSMTLGRRERAPHRPPRGPSPLSCRRVARCGPRLSGSSRFSSAMRATRCALATAVPDPGRRRRSAG